MQMGGPGRPLGDFVYGDEYPYRDEWLNALARPKLASATGYIHHFACRLSALPLTMALIDANE